MRAFLEKREPRFGGGSVRVRQATAEDVPSLVALFQELDRMQADWRVHAPPRLLRRGRRQAPRGAGRSRRGAAGGGGRGRRGRRHGYGEARTPPGSRTSARSSSPGWSFAPATEAEGGQGARARGGPVRGRSGGPLGRAEDLRPQPGRDGVLGGPRVHDQGRAAHQPDEDASRAARGPIAGRRGSPIGVFGNEPGPGWFEWTHERLGVPEACSNRGEERSDGRLGIPGACIRELPRANRTYPGVASVPPRGAPQSCPSTTSGTSAGSTSPCTRTSRAASVGAARR